MEWLDKQQGNVEQFEKVPHTYLNEDTGEMHCSKCNHSNKTVSNSQRKFNRRIEQMDNFERFTEQHLHE